MRFCSMEYNSILDRERLAQFLEILSFFTISDDFEYPFLFLEFTEHFDESCDILQSRESSDESDFQNIILLSLNLWEFESPIDHFDIFSSKCF